MGASAVLPDDTGHQRSAKRITLRSIHDLAGTRVMRQIALSDQEELVSSAALWGHIQSSAPLIERDPAGVEMTTLVRYVKAVTGGQRRSENRSSGGLR